MKCVSHMALMEGEIYAELEHRTQAVWSSLLIGLRRANTTHLLQSHHNEDSMLTSCS
ncbi:hypothetical protein KUCAC02_025241, partial [Chaenocephalus aceratus]